MYLLLQQMNNPQHMMDGWGSSYGMIFMGIFWLLIIALIVILIWFLIKKGSTPDQQAPDESPLEILNKRYARGEIDEEQYQRMKNEISS